MQFIFIRKYFTKYAVGDIVVGKYMVNFNFSKMLKQTTTLIRKISDGSAFSALNF